eukprot:6245352-Prymnesium_polylepis.1
MALEVNPEAFVHVPMLYVPCTLNEVGLKAFVDTGAQMTVCAPPMFFSSSPRVVHYTSIAHTSPTRHPHVAYR